MRAFSSALVLFSSLPAALAQQCNQYNAGLDATLYRATPQPGGAGWVSKVTGPWKPLACCTDKYSQILATGGVEVLYPGYSYDACYKANPAVNPPMSPKCKQFMMWEEAYFSCDPYGSFYKNFNAPICSTFCNDYYDACKDDVSCVIDWFNGWNYDSVTGYSCPAGSTSPCQCVRRAAALPHGRVDRVSLRIWQHTSCL